MTDRTNYETGARKLMKNTGPDPSDDFSQDAAENTKPRDGMGLTRTNHEQAVGNDRAKSDTVKEAERKPGEQRRNDAGR